MKRDNITGELGKIKRKAAAIPVEADPATVPQVPVKDVERLKEYLLGGPKFDHFEIERDHNTGREIKF
jgi:hypothetical protein